MSSPSGIEQLRREAGHLFKRATPNACTAGQPSAPMTAGAWNQATRSTRSARSSDAASCAPPSTSTRVSPASPGAHSACRQSTPPRAPATSISATPASAKARRRSGSAPSRISIQVGVSRAVATSRGGQRRAQMAVGHHAHRGSGRKPGMRQVRSGSSAATVPTPTITASCRPRSACAARRAGSTGDPAAFARQRGDAPVQRGGQLQRDQRPALRAPAARTRRRPRAPPPAARLRSPRCRPRAAGRCRRR